MFARVGISECRNQHRTRVRRHVQAIGDERKRPEQTATEDFCDHHGRAQRNHRPRPALILFMTGTQKDVVVPCAECCVFEITHF